ncbi:MAG: ATP-binding cassette domain-containing protein, partial [Polaromonas sp.]
MNAGPEAVACAPIDAILSVSDITVRFGSLVAVNGVSFDAQRGHITSVIGPNGAGKSTLFNLISGAIRPSAGRVVFDGQDLTGASPNHMLAAGLARSFQITNLFFELSVRENLRLAAQFLEQGRGLLRPVSSSRL